MSFNLVAEFEYDEEELTMVLERAGSGITSTATIGLNELIDFSGVRGVVYKIVHKHAVPMGGIAPVSYAFVNFTRPLSDHDVDILKKHGFSENYREVRNVST